MEQAELDKRKLINNRRGERISLSVKKRFCHFIDMAGFIFVLEKYFIIKYFKILL